MPRSASVVSIRAPADSLLSEAVVFHMSVVETPLMVPPVNGSIAHGITSSSCCERATEKTPVTRLLRNFGNFLANSPVRL